LTFGVSFGIIELLIIQGWRIDSYPHVPSEDFKMSQQKLQEQSQYVSYGLTAPKSYGPGRSYEVESDGTVNLLPKQGRPENDQRSK